MSQSNPNFQRRSSLDVDFRFTDLLRDKATHLHASIGREGVMELNEEIKNVSITHDKLKHDMTAGLSKSTLERARRTSSQFNTRSNYVNDVYEANPFLRQTFKNPFNSSFGNLLNSFSTSDSLLRD